MKALSPATLLTPRSLVLPFLLGAAASLEAQSGGSNAAARPAVYRPPTISYSQPKYPQTYPPAPPPPSSRPATPSKKTVISSPPRTAPTAPPPGYKAYRPPTVKPTAPTTSKPRTPSSGSVESKVTKLEKNDRHQDLRLSNLERDVGRLPETVESGGYTPTAATMGTTYVVRPGDTLWRVAEKFNTSVNALRVANHLTGDTVAVGQALLIPGDHPAAAGQTAASFHTVKPGDTFSKIASTYKVSQDALAKANPTAYADQLQIGERLIIPGKKATTTTTASTPNSAAPSSSVTAGPKTVTHTVRKGESLGSIAKSHGISTASLVAANKLKNPNVVDVGQKLTIPSNKPSKPTPPPPLRPAPQLVRADADTRPLPGVTVPTLSSPVYSAPPPAPARAATPAPAAPKPVASSTRGVVAYRLERGDTVETVANMFGTTPEKIRELNKLSADRKLQEGDEVIVPGLGAVSVN